MNTCQTGPTTQTFGWDGLRRLTDIDAGSVHDLAYGYDDFNRRTFKQYEHLLPTIEGDIYAYDGGSRLSDVWYDDANPTAGAPGTSLAHLNIQQTKVQARISTTFNATTTFYSTGDPLHRTTSINSVPRTYDDKGNLTDNGAGRKFEYDAWNRMTRVLDGTSAELVRYEFDALSRRHKRFEGTTVTRYVYDGPRLLEEYVDPGTGVFALATRYIYGGGLDELIAIETGGLRYYTYRDALGSIEAITDSAGVVVERYDYDAFGMPTVTDGLGVPTPLGIYGEPTSQYGNDLWFTGARWDPESGNYHMRARQYEPLAGRFVSRDPLGYVDGPNAYSYGYSSPTNWTDPFGLEAGGSSGGNNPFLGTAMPASFSPEDVQPTESLSSDLLNIANSGLVNVPMGSTLGASQFVVGILEGALIAVFGPAVDLTNESIKYAFPSHAYTPMTSIPATSSHMLAQGATPSQITDAVAYSFVSGAAHETVYGGIDSFREASKSYSRGDTAGFVRNGLNGITWAAGVTSLLRGGYRPGKTAKAPKASTLRFCDDPARYRPVGMPKSWRSKPTRGEGGIEYFNPLNTNEAVRLMPGNPESPFVNSRSPYARQRNSGGHFLDANGVPGVDKSAATHIPFDQFKFTPQ